MKKFILKILGGLVILIMLLNINIIVFASNTTDLQSTKSSNNQKINDAQQDLQEVQSQKSETLKQVESLSSQITDYESQISDLDSQINDINEKINQTQDQINQKEKDFDAEQELLNSRLVTTYESGDTSYLDVILSSSNITDLISNYYLVTEVATYDAELLDNIQKEKQEIEDAKKSLEDSKSELDTAKASKESVSIQLKDTKSQKNTYVAQLSAQERNIQAEIDDLQAANVQIDKDIANAKAKYAAQLAAIKNASSSSSSNNSNSGGSTSGTSSSGFIMPVNSTITTGLYYSNGSYHGAVDFGASGVNGMPVYAVASGVVIVAQALTSSYGNHIIIMHPNGLFTVYAHGQSGSIRVSVGDTVSQGQQIMNVGSTGNSTGPHLHFEVRTSPGNYNNRVNPLNYLP